MTSANTSKWTPADLGRDIPAGLVVFLVALPLCLGVAVASGADPLAGVVAGIVGGIVVGCLSGSHTSVSGPAAGLTAVVATQIGSLGFKAFLLAVVAAGVIQVVLGVVRAGFLASFVPSAVIKGLLAAIGIIIILKQVPHLVGYDRDSDGNMGFVDRPPQPTPVPAETDPAGDLTPPAPPVGDAAAAKGEGGHNTFTDIFDLFTNPDDWHVGATVVGMLSVGVLLLWDRWKVLKKSPVPAPLVVVLVGVAGKFAFAALGEAWGFTDKHLVQIKVPDGGPAGALQLVQLPDFTQWNNPAVYLAALTIAAVASLETLLNLEAVDKIDPRRRTSPPSRELLAQGVGNVVSGLIGGLPVTSVIVRSSVNINSGNRTKVSAVVHGVLLLGCVVLIPFVLNLIPLSCLAAILIVTGFKLASLKLGRQMWKEGLYQFIPFAITVVAIVLTDLLVGVLLGLAVSTGFILWSNARRPFRRVLERHLGGEVVRIELSNQVSFLHRAALDKTLNEVPAGGHVLIDATHTDYVDPDVLGLIRDYQRQAAPARGVEVSLSGFRDRYALRDRIQYVDHSTREVQSALTPADVLGVLRAGHARFRAGERLTRDLGRQMAATAGGQHPLAVVVSCIDSRAPIELIFDVGVGDIFSVRIAGNVAGLKVTGSVEYACAVAGAKLVLVMGHTRCGAVTAAVDLTNDPRTAADATGCRHIDPIIGEIRQAVAPLPDGGLDALAGDARKAFVDEVARRNVARTVDELLTRSDTLRDLADSGRIAVVGAMYDVATGDIDFLPGGGFITTSANDRIPSTVEVRHGEPA